MDTGVADIDSIETDYTYQYVLTLDSASVATVAGQTAAMTLSDGTIVSGEVIKYSDSDNKLYLAHVGASDGDYHSFVTGRKINISGHPRTNSVGVMIDSDLTVLSVSELNNLSNNEQNDFFNSETADFLDFTESNPFGDPT
jgi:hypothetical protein